MYDGFPLAGVDIRIGADGRVALRGPMLFEGYDGDRELTAETLVDGWLRTGDVGRLDADGRLYLLDRVKDMIVTGLSSTNVFCRPVEDALASHPQVQAAAVIGVPHELHYLDLPDELCKQRLRRRNAGGEHQFQVSDAEFEQFTAYFVPPAADEGFNVVVHKP